MSLISYQVEVGICKQIFKLSINVLKQVEDKHGIMPV